jgi:cystathionine beta-lyase/cystathionine gamma-synthase
MKQHQENGMAVARFLESHPAVKRVFYPGLESDPQRELSLRQLRGYSGLLSIALKENDRDAVCRVLNRLRYFGIGVSWGGFESLAIPVELPAASGERRWGIRFSLGLETPEDLIHDLEGALR